MLTFEEFFAKKKIDLVQLQNAEPSLFAEFKKDFEPMGEKSFDHSKKFWFNKLRRIYHLKEEPKPAKTEIEMTEIASQAEPLDSPTIEQKPAYTPRFKSANPAQNIPDTDPASSPGEKSTAAYTPRFRPGSTAAAPQKTPVVNSDQPTEEKAKPAYTPRFKMQTPVKQEDETKDSDNSVPSDETTEKPAAYKPRFNVKSIPAETPGTEQINRSPEETSSADEKPAAYKPRFNIKTIKPKSEE